MFGLSVLYRSPQSSYILYVRQEIICVYFSLFISCVFQSLVSQDNSPFGYSLVTLRYELSETCLYLTVFMLGLFYNWSSFSPLIAWLYSRPFGRSFFHAICRALLLRIYVCHLHSLWLWYLRSFLEYLYSTFLRQSFDFWVYRRVSN